MENISYLFAVFAVIWLVLFGYVFFLIKRQQQLKKDIETLTAGFDEKP